MEFFKTNYEKVLLVIVLLGLVGAVVALLIIIPQEQSRLHDDETQLFNPRVNPRCRHWT